MNPNRMTVVGRVLDPAGKPELHSARTGDVHVNRWQIDVHKTDSLPPGTRPAAT